MLGVDFGLQRMMRLRVVYVNGKNYIGRARTRLCFVKLGAFGQQKALFAASLLGRLFEIWF